MERERGMDTGSVREGAGEKASIRLKLDGANLQEQMSPSRLQ